MTTLKRTLGETARRAVAARTEALFRASGALREGHFTLKSGRHSDAYLEKFQVLQDPAATSELSNTGLWRTLRPVIDDGHCNRCSWVCSTLCPDSAIHVDADHRPRIDYDHCKGCMVCVAVCPRHAIRAVSEREAGRTFEGAMR